MYGRVLRRVAVGFLVWALALAVPCVAPAQAASGVTLVTAFRVDDVARSDEILLAALRTQSDADAPVAFGLKWAKDTSSWFPTWALYLTSDAGLLPTPSRQVSRITPVAGHRYEAILSYAPELGALSVRVVDQTEGRMLYADTLPVGTHDGPLQALEGALTPAYVPVGATWDTGIGEPGATFLPLTVFDTKQDPAVLRLRTPAPYPPGAYRVVLEHGGTVQHAATLTPEGDETRIPLPLGVLPLGRSTVRLEYVDGGQVLLSESRTIVVGRVDLWLDPVVLDRREGVVRSTFHVAGAEPVAEELEVEVEAVIEELVWNAARRQFDYVPYGAAAAFKGTIDLSAGRADFSVAVPVPDRPGNWRVRLSPRLTPEVASYVSGNERFFSTHVPADVAAGAPYTIVVFPDTQYLAASYPHIFLRMTDWVTAHAAEYNIAALLHVGDITDNNSAPQWQNAATAMSLLHGVVPYVLTIGNHDMIHGSGLQNRGETRINAFFPVEAARVYSNLVDTMVPGRIENSYALFEIGGDRYLVVALEFGPPDEAIEWANTVARQYPDHRMILLTHSYLSRSGGLSTSPLGYDIAQNPATTVNAAPEIWNRFVRLHANAFMVISGHTSPDVPTVPHRVALGAARQPVFELLFDFQNQENGGNGWLGLMTFLPDHTVHVRLYSPYLDEWGRYRDPNGFTSELVIDLTTGLVRQVY